MRRRPDIGKPAVGYGADADLHRRLCNAAGCTLRRQRDRRRRVATRSVLLIGWAAIAVLWGQRRASVRRRPEPDQAQPHNPQRNGATTHSLRCLYGQCSVEDVAPQMPSDQPRKCEPPHEMQCIAASWRGHCESIWVHMAVRYVHARVIFDIGVGANLPGLQDREDRADADRRMSVLLRVQRLPCAATSQARRLLRVLLIRIGPVSTQANERRCKFLSPLTTVRSAPI
jgi:hypothetical protein